MESAGFENARNLKWEKEIVMARYNFLVGNKGGLTEVSASQVAELMLIIKVATNSVYGNTIKHEINQFNPPNQFNPLAESTLTTTQS